MGLVDRMESQKREMVYKELLGKKYSSLNDFDLVYTPMEEITLISVKRLLFEGKIGQAEDLLFSSIEKNKSKNSIFIAGEFYTLLMEMSDKELEEKNFSRGEIIAGIKDIGRILKEEIHILQKEL
ncbi:hypothetical protein HMPREF1639_08115 [Peptostreptococcus sp. MV1]|uniref:DUF6483 family protein n=1 Tax=Peptostreptococcus sp. MV1 TaxID=1219626 RepID=UPI00050FC67A|nr:DUF6483 family protein [Peptostreptococcus sp. MV1]KGF10589.1 hypothetical protein HMPREF1639_08115 [Peptostreptococcus sp. MV1]